jgi:hypothetical protein
MITSREASNKYGSDMYIRVCKYHIHTCMHHGSHVYTCMQRGEVCTFELREAL